jgi:hypothetical protein
MPAQAVVRPVWRSFAPRFAERAAEYVRAGGHAAIVHADRIQLLLGLDAGGELPLLGRWTLLTLGQSRWRRVRTGPAEGLASARVPAELEGAVLAFCDRDATLPGPVRRLRLDCLTCAACCRDADLVVESADLARWRAAGRRDLAASANLRRGSDGRVRLRMLRSGACRHLAPDRKCRIYALRPSNCAAFPAGSEACLSARRDTLGLVDH